MITIDGTTLAFVGQELAFIGLRSRAPSFNAALRVFSRAAVMQYFPQLCDTFSFTTSMTLPSDDGALRPLQADRLFRARRPQQGAAVP
jgi:hypothetical protein